MEPTDLAQEYRAKTDDELLDLSLDPTQLTREGSDALKRELARRRIDLEQFALQQKPKMGSLDEVPQIAKKARRQEFLTRWYKPTALVPFVVVLFVSLKFFPESNSWIQVAFVGATLLWGIGITGYSLFLTFTLRCPACGWRFGASEKCMSCGLPRHGETASNDLSLGT